MKNLIPLIDSRKLIHPAQTIFFALDGNVTNGHDYIQGLYQKGVRNFFVKKEFDISSFPDADFTFSDNVLFSLHNYSIKHRKQFEVPVVAITGSNGKTIIKEWLYELLNDQETISKTPRSYNSQIGVPLSVCQLEKYHTLGIYEAGISRVGEMAKLEKIISPTYGIFSNIGSAHESGFDSQKEKLQEKLILFKNVEKLIYRKDNELINHEILKLSCKLISWSNKDKKANYFVVSGDSKLKINDFEFNIPFSDWALTENLTNCLIYIIENYSFTQKHLQERIYNLKSVNMRLELKSGKDGCRIIDDSYNNDFLGLQIALDFLDKQSNDLPKVLILSEMMQSRLQLSELHIAIKKLLIEYGVDQLVLIGNSWTANKNIFDASTLYFDSTDVFLNKHLVFHDKAILIKGARKFHFEKIVDSLAEKHHKTVLKIDLNAIVHNLNYYKSNLKSSTKIMVMVKAFAYGSGGYEIANLLQNHQVDYLAVAYADEGVELRKKGILLPIMVMNPQEEDFKNIINFDLEPELYSIEILNNWLKFSKESIKVHLKIDTGMHRLGFEENDITELVTTLKKSNLTVESIFTHLSSADMKEESHFTENQIQLFDSVNNLIKKELNIKPIEHVLNSSGIINYPEHQKDMVRLGIGLYGFDPVSNSQHGLQNVTSLHSSISQIKNISKGESIGYARKGKAEYDMKLATISIGYADGFNRALSNGAGEVYINGKFVKVIGNVCMDMIMVDITNCNCSVGDEVEIFGKNISIMSVSDKLNTIPYETLTSVSERVKRVYVAE